MTADIRSVIHQDHYEILHLLQQMIWEANCERLTQLATRVVLLMEMHLACEEFAIYGRLLQIKQTAAMGKLSWQEHVGLRRAMNALKNAPAESVEAIERFASLRYMFTEHVAEEEEVLIPVLEKLFDDEQREDMYQEYQLHKAHLKSEWISETRGLRRSPDRF